MYNLDFFTEQQLMFLEGITISKMKGTMQMKMQKLVGVTTKKVKMIQIILMLKFSSRK